MNLQSFLMIGYNKAKKLLKLSNLLQAENTTKYFTFSPSKFSKEFFEVSQTNNYSKIYKTAREKYDYDFLLIDQSIFQFSCEENNEQIIQIRYAFYEPPTMIPTYEEFLEDNELDYFEVGDAFFQDYEQAMAEAKIKISVTPIRYDYDVLLYKGLEHSASHFHIGHNNEIRIPTKYILSPKAFVGFVIKQVYRKQWIYLFKDNGFIEAYQKIKDCPELSRELFSTDEDKDFFIV